MPPKKRIPTMTAGGMVLDPITGQRRNPTPEDLVAMGLAVGGQRTGALNQLANNQQAPQMGAVGPQMANQPEEAPGFEALVGRPMGNRSGGRPGGAPLNTESQSLESRMGAMQAAQNAVKGNPQVTPGTSSWLQNNGSELDRRLNILLDKGNVKDPVARARIKEILIAGQPQYNARTGHSLLTDLKEEINKDPKIKISQNDLINSILKGDIAGLEKYMGLTPGGGAVPGTGTTTLPSNVPAPVEALINHGANMGAALTGIGGQGIGGLLQAIGNIPGVTADMLSGISNLLGGGGGGQGGGGAGGGTGDQSRSDLFEPNQIKAMDQLLGSAVPQLTGNQYDFEPIRQRAYKEYNEKGLPGLAERFTNLGGRRGAGSFARQATQGRADLESQLAALESQYGQQRFGQLQNMAGLGLQRRFEPHIIEKAPSGMQQFVQGVAPDLFKMAAKAGLGGLLGGPAGAAATLGI